MKVCFLSVTLAAALIQAVCAMPLQGETRDVMMQGAGVEMTGHQMENTGFHGMEAHGVHDFTRRDVQMTGNEVLDVLARDDLLSGLLGKVTKDLNPADLLKKLPELTKDINPADLVKTITDLAKKLAGTLDADTIKKIEALIPQVISKITELLKGLKPPVVGKRDNGAMMTRDMLNEMTTELHTLYRHGQQESATQEGQDKMALAQAVTQLIAVAAMNAA
ncbi:hypothetical protein BC940DRAFT_294937 [Gongronella butleri]|nr:hypothetical protein BC940DRAFT_294937 [Gongronella butleri]